MGQRLPDDQMRLYRRIDEALYYIWDPIGVSTSAWARDEYQNYLPHVFTSVMQAMPRTELRDYLVRIESEHMGLGEAPWHEEESGCFRRSPFRAQGSYNRRQQQGEQVGDGDAEEAV